MKRRTVQISLCGFVDLRHREQMQTGTLAERRRFIQMRRTLTAVTIILCALVTPTYANNDRTADVEQELRKLVQTWDEAFGKGDPEALGRLLADEFEFVGGPKKADYLASFKTRKANILSAVSTDVRVQVYDDVAIVTGVDAITSK